MLDRQPWFLPMILHGPLVTLRRKGYQGRSPWLGRYGACSVDFVLV
jgi:hypothetical protein